jgi:hypothetical protein
VEVENAAMLAFAHEDA